MGGMPKWGAVDLLENNYKLLGREGALADKFLLPATLVDVIDLVHSLGIEYIWIDALCIIQKNDLDKKDQIRNMSKIYGCSIITIIAASGSDSNAGLPGIRDCTRFYEQQEIVVIPPSDDDIGLSLLTTVKSHPKDLGVSYNSQHDDFDLSM